MDAQVRVVKKIRVFRYDCYLRAALGVALSLNVKAVEEVVSYFLMVRMWHKPQEGEGLKYSLIRTYFLCFEKFPLENHVRKA